MSREVLVLGKERQDDTVQQNVIADKNQLVPSVAGGLGPVTAAVDKLRDGIIQRLNSPDYVTLAMHVNLHSAKADLIPVPHPENMRKLKDNFDALPTKVQEIIRKNVPEEQLKAAEEIYEYLEKQPPAEAVIQRVKAIESKDKQD